MVLAIKPIISTGKVPYLLGVAHTEKREKVLQAYLGLLDTFWDERYHFVFSTVVTPDTVMLVDGIFVNYMTGKPVLDEVEESEKSSKGIISGIFFFLRQTFQKA